MHARDSGLVAGARCANGDDRLDHAREVTTGVRPARKALTASTQSDFFALCDEGRGPRHARVGFFAFALLEASARRFGRRTDAVWRTRPASPRVSRWLCCARWRPRRRPRLCARIYAISLIGLPIGVAEVSARLSGNHYDLDAHARLAGVASVDQERPRRLDRRRRAHRRQSLSRRLSPPRASSDTMTRTIRMAMPATPCRASTSRRRSTNGPTASR